MTNIFNVSLLAKPGNNFERLRIFRGGSVLCCCWCCVVSWTVHSPYITLRGC